MKKIIAVILILTGLAFLAYPKLNEAYYDYQQQALVRQWQESLANIEQSPPEPEVESSPQDPAPSTEEAPSKTAEEQAAEKKQREDYIRQNTEGMLKIDKINLKLPVLKGATQKNLLISLASVERTGKPGEAGNYCIAGHRNRTYGRNFNRLDELQVGDTIEVDTVSAQYVYKVTQKLYVQPEDTWVLRGSKEAKEITLITCHPMIKPTQRLIVKGVLEE